MKNYLHTGHNRVIMCKE